MTEKTRFDFAPEFWDFMTRARELKVIDDSDVFCLGAKHAENPAHAIDEVIEAAFASRNLGEVHREKHAILCRMADTVGPAGWRN